MTAAKQTAPPQDEQRPKFTLNDVTRGRKQQPFRVTLFGPEGIGKTTFGAGAPNPIFLGAEDGSGQLDVARLPQPKTWGDVEHALHLLASEAHAYKTLVVDTLDWLEPLNWAFICERDRKSDIEDYGYGKGYQAALDEWRRFLAALERLRAKQMHVVLLAHAWLKAFKNPEGPDFDRYELKLNLKAGGLLKEWSDAVLFANYETYAVKEDATKEAKKTRVRGVSTGARLLFAERTAAYDAKNRYGLPASMPLSWESFETAAVAGQPADPKVLTEEIQRKAADLGAEEKKKVLAAIGRANGDAVKLSQLNNYTNSRLAEQAAKES